MLFNHWTDEKLVNNTTVINPFSHWRKWHCNKWFIWDSRPKSEKRNLILTFTTRELQMSCSNSRSFTQKLYEFSHSCVFPLVSVRVALGQKSDVKLYRDETKEARCLTPQRLESPATRKKLTGLIQNIINSDHLKQVSCLLETLWWGARKRKGSTLTFQSKSPE